MPAAVQDPDCPALPPVPFRGRRLRSRRLGKAVMVAFASLWVIGCVVGLCYAFSAVRIHNAGCPDCILYPP